MRPKSKRRGAKNARPILVAALAAILLALILLTSLWLFSSAPAPNGESRRDNSPNGLMRISQRLGKTGVRAGFGSAGYEAFRIAIVIPFVGKGPENIPSYLGLFCGAAAGSASLVDFLIFHNGVLDSFYDRDCPPNVKFISFGSLEKMTSTLVRVVNETKDGDLALKSRERLSSILATVIGRMPYLLVEFKPATGHIFEEYLEGYSHWGYSDLDIVFGDLNRWITVEELRDYDIVTYGFGDQNRLYMRGQFTFHKNNPKVNQIWRDCEYLSKMDQRFSKVISEKKKFKLESAEGCYSVAVLKRKDIKVKYAVKAFTDVYKDDTVYSHGLFIGLGSRYDRTIVFKSKTAKESSQLLVHRDTLFEGRTNQYNRGSPLQWEIGEKEEIPSDAKDKSGCGMYWMDKKYRPEICITGAESTDTVYWINGQLFKQQYELFQFENGVESAPFFHFQEWKRTYRHSQLSTFSRSNSVSTFVLGKDGAIPISPQRHRTFKLPFRSFFGLTGVKWTGEVETDREKLPGTRYCLHSEPEKDKPWTKCDQSVSWRDKEQVEIINGAPEWNQINTEFEVTLALTLQLTADQTEDETAVDGFLKILADYLDRWQDQPSVVVIHVAGVTEDAKSTLRAQLSPDSALSPGLETCLVAVIFSENERTASRKALLNMVADAAPTRWVLSGFELERGVMISHETAFFAHRTAQAYQNLPGHAWIIPQFGTVQETMDWTLKSIWEVKKANALRPLPKLDTEDCSGDEDGSDENSDVFGSATDVWWKLTEPLVSEDAQRVEAANARNAALLEDLQVLFVSLLTEPQHYNLYATDAAPILMTDNLGPREGMITSEIAREVEEFGGRQCYNGLRLAQMAGFGYNINVLAGAYAASTESTRKTASAQISAEVEGTSRCHGCFIFDEKHDNVLEAISKDERHRPAKATLLWNFADNAQLLRGE